MNCINCGVGVTSKICPNCGQTNPAKKINFKNMWFDFQSRIYGFDGMFPRTIRDLTIRPGIAAHEYIEGNRIKYYGPVGYFFLMITLVLLLLSLVEVSFYDLMIKSSTLTEIKENSGQEKFLKLFSEWIVNNMRIFSFLIIPFSAIGSRIIFRKSGLNLLEHSVLVFYTHGHIYWLTILSMFIFKFTGYNPFRSIQPLISILLFGIGCSQLFNYQSKVKAFFKGLAVAVIGMLFFIFFLIATGSTYFYFHPEYFELLRPKNN